MPHEARTQSINTTVVASLGAFRIWSHTFEDSPSKVLFQMSIADSLVTPSLDQSFCGEIATPKKRWVVCQLFHPYISAYKGPKLHSHIFLRLLLLVLEAQFASEPRDAHTHACPVTIYPLACRNLDQLGSRDPFLSVRSWVLGALTETLPAFWLFAHRERTRAFKSACCIIERFRLWTRSKISTQARALESQINPRSSTCGTEEGTCKERRFSQSQSCSYISCLVCTD